MGSGNVIDAWRQLRPLRPERALDLQGLIQSALVGRSSRPRAFFGFSRTAAREGLASLFYTHPVTPSSVHVVDRNLELARAAGATHPALAALDPIGARRKASSPANRLSSATRSPAGRASSGPSTVMTCWPGFSNLMDCGWS